MLVAAASASDIAVDSLAFFNPGDGACDLFEAVEAANTDAAVDACPAGSGWDRILFEVTGTVFFDQDLEITDDLSIIGPGAALLSFDGQDSVRLLDVGFEQSLLLAGVTLRNGRPQEVNNSSGGGLAARPGSRVAIFDSVVESNYAASGGGISIDNETDDPAQSSHLLVVRSTIRDNEAYSSGGGAGIRVGIDASARILDSTISNNHYVGTGTTMSGGGLLAFRSSVDVLRSTVSGNSAPRGGGLATVFGELTVRHSTLTLNSASDDEGGGGIRLFGSSTFPYGLTLANSVIADNTATPGPDISFNASGTIVSEGHNLVGNNSDASTAFPEGNPNGNGDIVGTGLSPQDPNLSALLSLGGPTTTHEPNFGSPLIDSGSCADQRADQRGYGGSGGRSVGAACDIGAFETGATDPDLIFDSTFEAGTTHRWSVTTVP